MPAHFGLRDRGLWLTDQTGGGWETTFPDLPPHTEIAVSDRR
jgi:hypothetical protein